MYDKNMKNILPGTSQRIMRKLAIAVATAIIVSGCASTPPPTEQMAVSRAALSNATSAGGNEFAPLQIKSATEKMAAAERAMAGKDYARARQLAEQAQVDAQLAEAMARTAKAQKAADALKEDSRALRQEINRKAE